MRPTRDRDRTMGGRPVTMNESFYRALRAEEGHWQAQSHLYRHVRVAYEVATDGYRLHMRPCPASMATIRTQFPHIRGLDHILAEADATLVTGWRGDVEALKTSLEYAEMSIQRAGNSPSRMDPSFVSDALAFTEAAEYFLGERLMYMRGTDGRMAVVMRKF